MPLFRSLLFAASIPLFSIASAYIVTTEKWEPDAPLVPGKTLFYTVVVEAKDTVVLVDVILANGILGNTSDVFADSDLRKKDDASAGFTVPFVPPGKQYTVRLVETSTKRFLADSPQFEIFALNGAASSGASSLPATTLPALSTTTTNSAPSGASNSSPGASSASPSSASNPPATSIPLVSKTTTNTTPSTTSAADTGSKSNASGTALVSLGNEPKSKTPVGAIVGGIVGGLAVIGLIVFFLLWRRRQRITSNTIARGTDNEKDLSLAPPGPHAVEPYTLPPSSLRPGAGLDSTASLTGTDARSMSVGPLPSKLGYGVAETSSFNAGSSTQGESLPNSGPSTNLTRVDQLRLERERINRELAALEQRRGPDSNTTGSSSYGASSYMPPSTADSRSNHESLAKQLATLQAQIRQLEERQQRRESDLPPMYDGPPESPASVPSSNVAATSSPYPGGSKR